MYKVSIIVLRPRLLLITAAWIYISLGVFFLKFSSVVMTARAKKVQADNFCLPKVVTFAQLVCFFAWRRTKIPNQNVNHNLSFCMCAIYTWNFLFLMDRKLIYRADVWSLTGSFTNRFQNLSIMKWFHILELISIWIESRRVFTTLGMVISVQMLIRQVRGEIPLRSISCFFFGPHHSQ